MNNTEEARPACDGDYEPFWALIEHPGSASTAAFLAERYCGTCPLRDTHLYATTDNNWVPAAQAIREQLSILARRRAANVA